MYIYIYVFDPIDCICGSSLAGTVGSNPTGAWMYVCCDCCQLEVSATGRSLIQRSPTEYDVSEFDVETSTMRRPRPARAVRP
jgi:ribosome-binding protein aMBF1 (putative translation factor)